MTQSTRTLLILLLFAFTVQEIHGSSIQTLSNAFTAQNGEVPILLDKFGYYVEADLDYKPAPSDKITKMRLSLSNSATLLGANCRDYTKYDCSAHKCSQTTSEVDFSYPELSGTAQIVNAEAFLDYSSWVLKTSAYVGIKCSDAWSEGPNRAGVIGLGTAGDASLSFIRSKIFSIDLRSGNESRLLFKYDESRTASDSKTVLHTDSNWRIPFTSGTTSMKIGGDTINFPDGKLVFDLHYDSTYDSISLPYQLQGKVVESFKNLGLECINHSLYFSCKFSGDINTLPNITLTVGGTSINIPPAIYTWNSSDTRDQSPVINFHFKATDPDFKFASIVTPEFGDAIILGGCFMKYYYTVFDSTGNKNTISLYDKGYRPPSFPTLLIVLAILFIITIIAAIVFCIQRKRKQAQANGTQLLIITAPNLQPHPHPHPHHHPHPNPSPAPYQYPVIHQSLNQQPGGYIPPPQTQANVTQGPPYSNINSASLQESFVHP